MPRINKEEGKIREMINVYNTGKEKLTNQVCPDLLSPAK